NIIHSSLILSLQYRVCYYYEKKRDLKSPTNYSLSSISTLSSEILTTLSSVLTLVSSVLFPCCTSPFFNNFFLDFFLPSRTTSSNVSFLIPSSPSSNPVVNTVAVDSNTIACTPLIIIFFPTCKLLIPIVFHCSLFMLYFIIIHLLKIILSSL